MNLNAPASIPSSLDKILDAPFSRLELAQAGYMLKRIAELEALLLEAERSIKEAGFLSSAKGAE